jgi:hypothetical protein
VFHDDTSKSVSANLSAIVGWHNRQNRERDVSIHFNMFKKQSGPVGTECLHRSQATLAANISKAMATGGGFINRGAKQRGNLRFLNQVTKPACLLEVCFVDSTADANLYRQNFEKLCRSIAASVAGVSIPGEPPPVEPPAPPAPPPTEPEMTGDNVVDVKFEITGDALVVINGEPINETATAKNKLELTLAQVGDIVVTIDGEDFEIAKPPSVMRPTLSIGSTGPLVRVLQTALGVNADGAFGPITEAAVKKFQLEVGLLDDGIVGARTWLELEREFNLPPYEPPPEGQWFTDIKASVFGGTADPNKSAYPPFDTITDKEMSVSLPWKFIGPRPKVRVMNRANKKEVICAIRDVGPWLTDDDYTDTGARPIAETCFKEKKPLPRGPHKGKIGNGAGIDLTPAPAKVLGISGMGQVDFQFVPEGREEEVA